MSGSLDESFVYLRQQQIEVERARQPAEPELPLQFGGGGGTSGPVEPTVPLREYVDKADEAVESRIMSAIDRLPTKSVVWGGVASIIGAIFTALAIVLAVLAFGGDRFDAGIGQADSRQAQLQRDQAQDAKLDEILTRLTPAK